jgi:pre-mRNA-splicing factor SYF1
MFERARDVYQEGVEAVTTVRDFTLVFEALTKFEQALVEAQIEEAGDEDKDMATGDAAEGDGADCLLTDDGRDIDLRLERLEWLLAQRPVLLSSVMLRQNPHNVQARTRHANAAYSLPSRLLPARVLRFALKHAWRQASARSARSAAGVAQARQAL